MRTPQLNHFERLARLCGVLALGSGLVACTGDIGGETPTGPPPPPDVEPLEVPATPELLEASGSCTPLRADERLLSVSPEGHAWLVVDGADGSSIRVLDALDASGMGEVVQEVGLTELAEVHAWTGGDAAVLTTDGLWRLEELSRVQLTPPEGFASPAVFCGDPGDNGFILAGGKLFERRVDGLWWGWDPGATGDAMPTHVIPYDGECQSRGDVLWMTSPDGTLWRVEPTEYSQPVRFEALEQAAVTDDLVTVLADGQLWAGPEAWQPWIFPNGAPTQLTASNGFVWMVSGGQLLRFDGETFVEVRHDLDAPITSVSAYAGGVWLTSDDTVCHQAVSPVVRVMGVRPFSRSTELSYDLAVTTSDPGAEVSAELDGEALALAWDDEVSAFVGNARLDHAGWHELHFMVDGADEGDRSLLVKRLPEVTRSWDGDIRPIYEANCTGSDCHQAGTGSGAPDLSEQEAWVSLAAKIRARVVDGNSMPPAASRGPDWGDDKVAIIAEWLEGGMAP